MKLIRQKQPWGQYAVKILALSVAMTAGAIIFMDRYRIGMDPQEEKCIPGITFYLIDRKDQELERGKTFVFRARGLEPVFRDGTQMVKFLTAMPEDIVEISEDQIVRVNGEPMGKGLSQAKRLGLSEEKFVGSGKIPADSYWFMGTSELSFDSRYWGTVKKEQIIGRAYPLF